MRANVIFFYLQLSVVQGDISDFEVDAIVHPTNASFYVGGEVGAALSKAGGDDFLKAVESLHKSHGDLETSGGENHDYHYDCFLFAIFC